MAVQAGHLSERSPADKRKVSLRQEVSRVDRAAAAAGLADSPSAIVELVQFSEKTVTFLLVRDWVLVENFGHSEDKILRAHRRLITHFGPWRPSVGRESAHNTSLGQYLGGRASERESDGTR